MAIKRTVLLTASVLLLLAGGVFVCILFVHPAGRDYEQTQKSIATEPLRSANSPGKSTALGTAVAAKGPSGTNTIGTSQPTDPERPYSNDGVSGLHELTKPAEGLITDLTVEEVKAAAGALDAERLRWYDFEGMTGDVSIVIEAGGTNETPKHIVGHVSVTRIDLPPGEQFRGAPWKYRIELSNSAEKWKVISEGSKTNTKFIGDSNSPHYSLKDTEWLTTFALLTMPRDILVPLYGDTLFPDNRKHLNQLVMEWTPLRNPSAKGVPDSYIFRDSVNPITTSTFSLANGRLSAFSKMHKGTQEGFDVTFAEYSQAASPEQLSYPTKISASTRNNYRIALTLSDLNVQNK